ncbi:hypothetical protein BV898_12950 [Hypsibius exemplaris]|uniref:HTH CENPB-type domain-containing protein n=1 Tax=Hypsibius exemplaris TaxID=2072580 RepID=A0A1W0WC86_HYPEX|nr:hypothetical protein BV898_12950 [Hypsibius exemplaris]
MVRHSYSKHQIAGILKRWKEPHGLTLRDFAAREKVGKDSLSRWIRNETSPVPIKRRGAVHPEWEKELESWVLERRSVGLIVTDGEIRLRVLEIAARDGVADFRASNGWLGNFKKRCKLCYRSPTHTARKEPVFDISLSNKSSLQNRKMKNCDSRQRFQ